MCRKLEKKLKCLFSLMARQLFVSQFRKQTLLVIYVSHKSIFPWLFSLHKAGKARSCRAVLEGQDHAHVHQIPRRKPRRELASCQLPGPLGAASSSTISVALGTSLALIPPIALAAKMPIFCPYGDIFFFHTSGSWRKIPGCSDIKETGRWLQPHWLIDIQI